MTETIKVKYFDEDITPINKTEKGDWIDLRCVGGKKVEIHNTITIDTNGNNVLKREKIKTSITWEHGLFTDEKGKTKRVSFFRYREGDFLMLDLGVAMELPEGFEADIVERSSTFATFTILQTNSFGVVDESYKGNEDKWFMPVLAMQDGFIIYDERLCQFRINKKMETPIITTVKQLDSDNRGGHGSTGTL